jgi:hypothetical protein
MTSFIIKKLSELNSENSFFHLKGFTGTAAPEQSTTLEWQIPNERWFTGGQLKCEGQTFGDLVSFYVVVKDAQGNDIYVNRFVEGFVIGSSEIQLDEQVPYVTLIPAGGYIRLTYTAQGINPVQIGLNLRLHRPKDVIS